MAASFFFPVPAYCRHGRSGQQALVVVLIPWSTQLGCAKHTDLVLDGYGPAGRDGLEDTAEENLMCLPALEPPVPCFCSCALTKQRENVE